MTIQPNQSILDAVLTRYGSLEAAVAFCLGNGIAVSLIPGPGTQYRPPEIEGGYDATEAMRYLHGKGIVIATADNGACGMVTGVGVSMIEVHSALASFMAGESAVGLEWCVVEGTHTAPSEDTHFEGPTTTNRGLVLESNTVYSFLIRTNCIGYNSAWRRVVFTTPPELLLAMVLRPVMMHVSLSAEIPSPVYTMQWGVDITASSLYGFGMLPMVPALQTTTKADWDAALPPAPPLTPAVYDPGGVGMLFHVPGPFVPGTVYMWYSHLLPDAVCRYIDVLGNIAPCMPVVVYEESMGVKKMMAQMVLGASSTLAGLFHLPITITHTGDNIHFTVAEHRIKALIGGLWVALTPALATGASVVLTFPVGRHTIGVFTTYQSAGSPVPPGPVAINAMVFEIAPED